MNKVLRFFLFILCLSNFSAARADNDLHLDGVVANAGEKSQEYGLGDSLTVRLTGLDHALVGDKPKNLTDFVLYIDGHELKNDGNSPVHGAGADEVSFALIRTAVNQGGWSAILAKPQSFKKDHVSICIGLSGQSVFLATTSGKPIDITLRLIRPNGVWIGIAGIIFIAASLLLLARKSDLLRDATPANLDGLKDVNGQALRRPYSLAQCQMAWWFIVVLGTYLFLWALTGDTNTLTSQALTLMGIGTATALGASMIESSKHPEDNPTLLAFTQAVQDITDKRSRQIPDAAMPALLATQQNLAIKLCHKNIFADILSDANGICLHRFQSLVWTVVLGVIFCLQVWQKLAMPEFDSTILAVLGISGGAYLGFKIPEKTA